MHFEQGGGALEIAGFDFAALALDVAKLVEGLVELTGEPVGIKSQFVDGLVRVDDVEFDGGLGSRRIGGAGE